MIQCNYKEWTKNERSSDGQFRDKTSISPLIFSDI